MKVYIPMLYTFLAFCLFITSCLTIYAFESPRSYEVTILDCQECCEYDESNNETKNTEPEPQDVPENPVELIIVKPSEAPEIDVEEAEKQDVKTNRWNITLTKNEIDLLARIVMLEAGGEPSRGQEAVVEVIFNRMYHEKFPNNLEKVLSQSGQFSTWKNRNIKAATPTDEVYESINNVLSGQTDILPYKTVYFALSALNNRIQTTIGNHVFCNY